MKYLQAIENEMSHVMKAAGRNYHKGEPGVRGPMWVRPSRRARIDKLVRNWMRAKGIW